MEIIDYHNLAVEAENIYGKNSRMDKLIEECAEVIHALQKYRKNNTEERLSNVISELGHLSLALETYSLLMNIRGKVVDAKIHKARSLGERTNRIQRVRNSAKKNDVGSTGV